MALRKLIAFMPHGNEDLPLLEALPEITSLLTTMFTMFQEKVDQAAALKQELNTLQADKASELDSLVGEIKYVATHSTNYPFILISDLFF